MAAGRRARTKTGTWLRLAYAGAGGRRASPRGRGRAGARRYDRIWALALFGALALLIAAQYVGLPSRIADEMRGNPARFDLAGTAAVSDGDTLKIGDRRVRLSGIDAPERDQTCTAKDAGRAAVACGRAATAALTALTAGARVGCTAEGEDSYGRMLATCYVGEGEGAVNLGRAMVRAGWALAYRRYSDRYVLDERLAQREGAGLWALDFDDPEDWRHRPAARR